jgi:hypothetical protein
MSDVEMKEGQASDAQIEVIAEQPRTDDAVPEVVELVPDEAPGIAGELLMQLAQEALERTMDASKRLDAALEQPVFRWRSYMNG